MFFFFLKIFISKKKNKKKKEGRDTQQEIPKDANLFQNVETVRVFHETTFFRTTTLHLEDRKEQRGFVVTFEESNDTLEESDNSFCYHC